MGTALSAQITVTESDLENVYGIGAMVSQSATAEASTYDIGNQGGGNSWDFSAVTFSEAFTFTIIDPAETPFASTYPTANRAFTYVFREFDEDLQDTIEGNFYGYLSLTSSGLSLAGINLAAEIEGASSVASLVYEPARPQFGLPLTFESVTTGSGTLTDNIVIAGIPFGSDVSTYDVSTTVDAFGTITFPDGTTEDCLRGVSVEEEIDSDMDTFTIITYNFIGKSGRILTIDTDESTASTSGMVTGDITFSSPSGTSSTSNLELLSGVQIEQLGPNPFATTAQVRFGLERPGKVNISLYNVQGQLVQPILNQELPAGNHQYDVNGATLPAGWYQLVIDTETGTLSRTLIRK